MKKLLTLILVGSLFIASLAVFTSLARKGVFSSSGENRKESPVQKQKISKNKVSEKQTQNPDPHSAKEENDKLDLLANLAHSPPLKGEREGQTNILVLGSSGEPHPSPKLTDSILIAMLNFDEKKLRAISIPRDLVVKNQEDSFQKVNSVFRSYLHQGEKAALSRTKKVCERITGLDIHYSVKINLNTIKTVVNELGGINIEVTEDIYDPAYPGPNYTYQEFKLKKGWRYLNGEQAVKFIRTRHSARGDFDRVKRQKALLASLYLKVEDMGPLKKFKKLLALRKKLQADISTDFKLAELKRLYFHRDKFDFESLQVDQLGTTGPNPLLRSTHMDLGGLKAYVLLPRAGASNYSEIHKWFKNKF